MRKKPRGSVWQQPTNSPVPVVVTAVASPRFLGPFPRPGTRLPAPNKPSQALCHAEQELREPAVGGAAFIHLQYEFNIYCGVWAGGVQLLLSLVQQRTSRWDSLVKVLLWDHVVTTWLRTRIRSRCGMIAYHTRSRYWYKPEKLSGSLPRYKISGK